MQLLFFDTFSHENSEDFNLDLVQFPSPVQVTEVRVIPLGTRVQADFPGGVRLGATNPSQFHVDFFVNDLSKSGAATFHLLGSLDYKHNVEIQVSRPPKIPTDGLLLRGYYSTITLAVFGQLTKVSKERPVTPPSPPPVSTSSPIKQKNQGSEQIIKVAHINKPLVEETPIESITSSNIAKSRNRPESSPIRVIASSSEKLAPASESSFDHSSGRSSRESLASRRDDTKSSSSSKSERKEPRRERDGERDRDRSGVGRSRDRPREPPLPLSSESEREGRISTRVSGTIAVQERISHTPPLPLQTRSRPPSPKGGRPRTPTSPHPSDVEARRQPTTPPIPLEQECADESSSGGAQAELFESLTPEMSPTEPADAVSDGEAQETGYPDYYEEILSDEEEMSESEADRILEFQGELEYDLGDDAYVTTFNPYHCEFVNLQHFTDPSLTPFEVEAVKKMSTIRENETESIPSGYELLTGLLRTEGRINSPEKWVEAIEAIPSLLISASSELKAGNEEVVDNIVEWCCEALDFGSAMQQPQAVFKVRQLKAGIKLATVLFSSSRKFIQKLLLRDVQKQLLSLYTKEYMALSLKLLILRALDASTRLKEGMISLVSNSGLNSESASLDAGSRTSYQILLDIFLAKQPTRASVAISALLNKVHFFEVLQKFTMATEIVAVQISSIMPITPKSAVETEEVDLQPMSVAMARDFMDKVELKSVVLCLQEILHDFCTSQQSIAQPACSLPVQTQFEIKQNPNNPYPHIYSLFNDCHFMESLMLLISFPLVTLQPTLVTIIRDLLDEFLASQHGMLFLLSNTAVCNNILRIMLQGGDEGVASDVIEDNPMLQLGLRMVHSLQALQCVDALLSEVRDASCLCCKEIDDPDILSNLHALYTMTFTTPGRSAVVNILASERNLEAILPFLQSTGNEELDLKLKKSACIGYATELLLMTVIQSESVALLENFTEKLLTICSQELTTKVQELVLWLAPTSKLSGFSHSALPHLCSIVVASIEDLVTCPGELITALRILQHFSIPPDKKLSPHLNDGVQEELKYKYVIVQLFANDMLTTFITILQKLCDAHEYPVLHAPSLVSQRGALLMAVIKPTVAMVMKILGYLIECRGTEFKDLMSVKTLLRVYAFLMSFPPTSAQSSNVQKVLMNIVDTLLTFTQPELDASDNEETLSNSLWTQMVREVFAYSLTSPNVFTSGLSVISELLPLPLPIHTQEVLPTDQMNKAINYRKLWSAHLHSLSSLIQDVITTLGGTSDQTLQHLVRRICIQLADLSAPTALVVVRGLLDAVLDGLAMIEDSSRDNFHFGHLSRLLDLLAVLMSNGCIKASLLHLIGGTSKGDIKYTELFSKLGKNLNSPPSVVLKTAEKVFSFQQSQECIASIFQSVCDDEITLMPLESQPTHLELISNSLPTREQFAIICGVLWDHLREGTSGSPSSIICLRTLVMLTEHDYGFYHLKTCLDNRSAHLHVILSSICAKFNKTNPDFVSGLSTFLELIRLLVSLEDEGPQRTLVVSPSDLVNYLMWDTDADKKPVTEVDESTVEKSNVDDEESDAVVDQETVTKTLVLHPLQQLEKLLTELIGEEASLEGQTLENVQWIIQFVKEKSKEQVALTEKEFPEVDLPPAESLMQQFSMRLTCLVGEVDEEALNSSFWLPQSGDDSDQETEQVPCNLKAMADEYCPGLDFTAELGNMFLAKDDVVGDKERNKSSVSKRRYQVIITAGSKEPPKKKPFIAPMRGRGGYARGMINSSRANDPFRSRPPNTSRPPSMHVDDFVAMEIFQPSSSSAAGQSSKRTNKDSGRGRGRGNFDNGSRDFGTTRGRFFQSTSLGYGRRDDRGRGGSRGMSSRSTTSNMWTREGVSPGQRLPSPSQSSKLKFGSITPRSYVRPGHAEPRSEPRVQRLGDPSVGRFSHMIRGVGSGHLAIWPPGIRSKERDSRFPGTNSQNRGRRETNRHPRAFTR